MSKFMFIPGKWEPEIDINFYFSFQNFLNNCSYYDTVLDGQNISYYRVNSGKRANIAGGLTSEVLLLLLLLLYNYPRTKMIIFPTHNVRLCLYVRF